MKVTPEHNAECKRLLMLMGVPYIDVSWCTQIYIKFKIYSLHSIYFAKKVFTREVTFVENTCLVFSIKFLSFSFSFV